MSTPGPPDMPGNVLQECSMIRREAPATSPGAATKCEGWHTSSSRSSARRAAVWSSNRQSSSDGSGRPCILACSTASV
eukprot:352000-Chlamydomonas_euryale.AAC.3